MEEFQINMKFFKTIIENIINNLQPFNVNKSVNKIISDCEQNKEILTNKINQKIEDIKIKKKNFETVKFIFFLRKNNLKRNI